jgi:hypothetical protein
MDELEGKAKGAGASKVACLRLDDARVDLQTAREQAYFNQGYDCGLAAGRAAKLLLASRTKTSSLQARFARDLCHRAVASELPRDKVLSAFLEAAWAIHRECCEIES